MASSTTFMQYEKVRKTMAKWQSQPWNVATDLIKRSGDVERIGERDFRIPTQLTNGGRFGTYDPNMGDMGRGTAMTGTVMTGSWFPLRLNFELSKLAEKATASREVAILSALKEATKSAFPEFMKYRDKVFHSDGTAVIAEATAHTTSGGKSIYTLEPNFGANRLVRGQYLTVYNQALTTVLSSATLYIESIDWNARKIRLSGTVAGAGADDQFCFEGVSGASPAGQRGLYYWNSTATSGTTAGINRANELEIIPNFVNANGGLTYEHGMSLYHKVLHRSGGQDAFVGLAGTAQQAAVYAHVMAIQMYDPSTHKDLVDRLPALRGKKTFMFAGLVHYIDIHQDQSRIDYIVPKDWGRSQLDDVGYFEVDGKKMFPLYGGSGAPAAGQWFGLTVEEDYFCVRPGAGGVIYGLTLPASYL